MRTVLDDPPILATGLHSPYKVGGQVSTANTKLTILYATLDCLSDPPAG